MDWFGNKIVYCVLLCSLIYACKPAPEAEPGDRLIASVYNENLYWSEIQDIIPKDVSAQDSQLYVTGYINRWIKDQLMMREAERNIPKELNLEQLVNDYRKSLIRYNYEKLLVDNYQDSTVTPDELAAYYEKNKSQYPLKYTIIRCLYFKIDGKDKNLNKLRKEMAMDQLDVTQIQQLGDQANIQFTDTMKWYRALDIINQKNIRFDYVFFLQGSSDTQTPAKEYATRFYTLHHIIQGRLKKSGSDPAWIVARHSRCDKLVSEPIWYVQQAIGLRDNQKHYFVGPDINSVGMQYRRDRCHLNQAGQELVSDMWLESLQAAMRKQQK